MERPFFPQPKPSKKVKEPYKGLQTKKPLQAKTELKAKSALKQKPKLIEKRPAEVRKKKPKTKKELKNVRQGLKVPNRGSRSEFSNKERERILAAFGGGCAECRSPFVQFHHAKFRSGSGRGVFRNGVPLCEEHHTLAHKVKEYADKWREYLKSIYGGYYYMDKWDLWLLDLIEDPSDLKHEEFMLDQQYEVENKIAATTEK